MKDGLLGFLDSPAGAGLLSAVAGGMAGARRGTPWNNMGRAGIAGLTGYTAAQDDIFKKQQLEEAQKMQTLQRQQAEFTMSRQQKEMDRETQMEDAAKSAFKAPTPGTPATQRFDTPLFAQDALNGGSPKPYNLSASEVPATPGTPGGFDQNAYVEKLRQISPFKAMEYEQNLKKANAPIKLGKTERLLDPLTNKELVGAAPEPIDYNKAFLPDGTPNKPFQEYSHRNQRAGASSVSVNTGQKGLENEMKFSAAFKGEPIYKAHQDVQSAHGQITQALNLKSPAGDLAGATKLMKILDPGSVVRESELALAMAASGALDRLTNYGNMVITGQKLTPTQRVDFQKLADELSGESVKQYNSKRDEYKTFSSKYGLDSEVLLGKPAQNKQDSKPSDAKTFDAKPPAQQFKGKFVTSPDGKRYQSDGLIWKEVK